MLPCPAFSFYWFPFIMFLLILRASQGHTPCGGLRMCKKSGLPSTTWAQHWNSAPLTWWQVPLPIEPVLLSAAGSHGSSWPHIQAGYSRHGPQRAGTKGIAMACSFASQILKFLLLTTWSSPAPSSVPALVSLCCSWNAPLYTARLNFFSPSYSLQDRPTFVFPGVCV